MEKYDIIKEMQITDELSVLVVKKKKQEYHTCGECKHFKFYDRFKMGKCEKYDELVLPVDFCIEDGM